MNLVFCHCFKLSWNEPNGTADRLHDAEFKDFVHVAGEREALPLLLGKIPGYLVNGVIGMIGDCTVLLQPDTLNYLHVYLEGNVVMPSFTNKDDLSTHDVELLKNKFEEFLSRL